MKHLVKHDLSPEDAKQATEKALEAYQRKLPDYSPTVNWANDKKADIAFSAKGMKVTGSVELQPGAIALDLDVPFVLRPFKKKAMEVVEREIKKWIDRAKNGELR